jgi:hypothetical protein
MPTGPNGRDRSPPEAITPRWVGEGARPHRPEPASLRASVPALGRRPGRDLAGVEDRLRANFAYVDNRYPGGTVLKLCRPRQGSPPTPGALPSTGAATTTTRTPTFQAA